MGFGFGFGFGFGLERHEDVVPDLEHVWVGHAHAVPLDNLALLVRVGVGVRVRVGVRCLPLPLPLALPLPLPLSLTLRPLTQPSLTRCAASRPPIRS